MKTSDTNQSIARHRDRFVDALRRGDAGAASSVYDVQAHLLAPSAPPMVGRDDIRAYWQAGIDAGVADVSLVVDEINHNDGLAYETGAYAFRVAEPGEDGRIVERGHYVQVHKRQADGSWLRTVEIFSPGGSE
jgi:ketosteroid isomerase-like protein